MIFKQLKVGSFQNFAYIIGDEAAKECAIVDPGWDVDRLVDEAKRLGLRVRYIINTHTHSDHVNGNEELAQKTGAKIIAHESARIAKDMSVKEEDIVKVGSVSVKVIHTPGHCPDHICLLVDGKLLTGDTLFVGECGRTDLPGGSAADLHDSLFRKILKLDDSTEVYPGHDYGLTPHSTIRHERLHNYTLKPRSKDEFVRFMAQP